MYAKLCVCLGACNWDKMVKVQEPLPNRLVKQQQEVDIYSSQRKFINAQALALFV